MGRLSERRPLVVVQMRLARRGAGLLLSSLQVLKTAASRVISTGAKVKSCEGVKPVHPALKVAAMADGSSVLRTAPRPRKDGSGHQTRPRQRVSAAST